MNFQLVENWDAILKKAWSVKFTILAALLSGLEVTVAILQPAGIPNGPFAAIGGVISMLAFGSRFVAQKELTSEAPPKE